MATLQKIRNRSVLLVSVIFVALFLFIITIIDNPVSLFVDQTSVAKVNGQKISYEEYNECANMIREQDSQATDADAQALQTLVTEALYKQEFDKLGITVTDKELSSYITADDAPYGIVAQFVQQFGTTPAEMLNAINDPASYGLNQEQVMQLANAFSEFENNIADQLMTQKLMSLLYGTINANKLDAKQSFEEGNTTYTLASVTKTLYEVTDSVTPAEIKAYYNAHRESYKIDYPTRYVRYVTLDIVPSQKDRQNAVATAREALEQIQAGENMDAILGNSTFIIEHQVADAATVEKIKTTGLRDFINNSEVGDAQIIAPNTAYSSNDPHLTIARLVNRETRVNTAMISQVVLDNTIDPEVIIEKLNSGVAADSIEGVSQVIPAQQFTFDQISGIIDTLQTIGEGVYINLGQAAVAVESFGEPEQMVEYYTATLNIEPSRETTDALNTRMREFLISAPTAELFNHENAMMQGLMVHEALVDQSSSSLDNLDDSRGMVAWAMDAKKGAVSKLYTDSKNTRLAAVALVDEYENYLPYTFPGIESAVTQGAQMEKNSENIINSVAGKANSLQEYCELMGAQKVDTLRGINLSGHRYGPLAAMRAAEVGEIVGPTRWNSAVIVYSVVDQKEGEMPFDEQSTSMQFRRQAQNYILGQSPETVLLGNGKVKYSFLRFTRQ